MTTKQIMRWVLVGIVALVVSLVMVVSSAPGQWQLALTGSALAIVVGLLRAGWNLTSERRTETAASA